MPITRVLKRAFLFASGSAAGICTTLVVKDHLVTRYQGNENLENKTVVITGASSGIGQALTKELAKKGARVIMACRDEDKCIRIRRKIVSKTNNQNIFCSLVNLNSLNSIQEFVNRLKQKNIQINVLVNNAAEMRCPLRHTQEGFETQLGVNHLGHFYLTYLLLDNLKANSPSRIVNVTSVAHHKGKIDFENLNSQKSYKPDKAYYQSKLANILFTKELALKLKDSNVFVYSVDPGLTNTKLTRHMGFFNSVISGNLIKPFLWLFEKTPFQASQGLLYVILSPDLANQFASGKHFKNCKEAPCSKDANDPVLAKKLWLVSERWTINRNLKNVAT